MGKKTGGEGKKALGRMSEPPKKFIFSPHSPGWVRYPKENSSQWPHPVNVQSANYTIYRKVLSSSNILVDLTTTPIFLKTSIQRILIWRKIYLVDKCDGIYFESATTEILGCLIEGFLSGCLLNLFWHSHYKDVPKLPCIQMLSGILLPN